MFFGLPDHVFPVFGFDDFDMRSPAVKAAVQFQHAARPETDGQAAVGVFADLLAGVKNVVFGGGGRAGVKKPFVFKCRFAEQSEIFTAMVFQAKVTVADKIAVGFFNVNDVAQTDVEKLPFFFRISDKVMFGAVNEGVRT